MMKPFYTLITQDDGDARHMMWTAKSLASQDQAQGLFQWLFLTPQEKLDRDDLPVLPTLCASKDECLAQATGDYFWFLPNGTCFAERRTLVETAQTLKNNLRPDLAIGSVRRAGQIETMRTGRALAFGPIIATAGLLIKNTVLKKTDAFMQQEAAADYLAQLDLFAQAKTSLPLEKVLCDVPTALTLAEKRAAILQWQSVRRHYTHQPAWINALITKGQLLFLSGQNAVERLQRFLKRH